MIWRENSSLLQPLNLNLRPSFSSTGKLHSTAQSLHFHLWGHFHRQGCWRTQGSEVKLNASENSSDDHLRDWENAWCMHDIEMTILTSDRDFGQCFTLANLVAGHTLVCPSIVLLGQVDLEVSSLQLSSLRQAAVDLSPLVTQGWGAMGQALQSDYFTHSHWHVIRQGSGIGWGCSNQRNVS